MRISDGSSDVGSSDLSERQQVDVHRRPAGMGGEGRETGNGAPQPAAGWARSPLRGAVPRDAPHPIIGRETERHDADEQTDGPRGPQVAAERDERYAEAGGHAQGPHTEAFPLAP